MFVSRSEYLNNLKREISEEERTDLENDDIVLISSYNRETMLRMLHSDSVPEGRVDTDSADALRKGLKAYLDQYMQEYPQGHKWIILACLFLSQIAGEPMHPQQLAGWTKEGEQYYCRAREDQPGSLCHWCVCRKR